MVLRLINTFFVVALELHLLVVALDPKLLAVANLVAPERLVTGAVLVPLLTLFTKMVVMAVMALIAAAILKLRVAERGNDVIFRD